MTSSILHALLFAHLFSVLTYPRPYFYSHVYSTYHAPTFSYYSSPAYSSHYAAPHVASNGHVVHSTAAATAATSTAARGTPVAQARPVATATPVAHGRPVATATATPVGRPTATATPARPTATAHRPTTRSRWGTVRRAHSFGHFCFVADAQVLLPSGSTAAISSLREGASVLGWPNAAAAAAGKPAAALTVSRVLKFSHGAAPLRGLHLTTRDGESLSLPPFVTANHPLVTADGGWAAADAELARAELDAYVPNATLWKDKPYHAPAVATMAPGLRLLVTPSAAGSKTVRVPEAAKLERIVDDAAQATGDPAAAYDGPVYSLELEEADLSVYVVNGVLVMD